jgi:hypothetical protein
MPQKEVAEEKEEEKVRVVNLKKVSKVNQARF